MLGTNLIRYRGILAREDSTFAFEEKKKHIQETTSKLLSILHAGNIKLTFFVTGRLYDAIPETIHAISEEGHEIGWHGHYHRPIMNVKTLMEDLRASEKFIRRFRPKGFRAPWTLFDENLLPILKEANFLYDSSLFGPAGSSYEINGMKVFPVTSFPNLNTRKPIYTTNFHNRTGFLSLPVGSNFIFSLLRHRYTHLLRIFERKSVGCIFYIHNWQVFPWKERELSLLRNNLRYVQKFPVADAIRHLMRRHKFARLDAKLDGNESPKVHYLTFDME